jgi:threonine aldolase
MHTFTSEGGGSARLAGVTTRIVSQSQAALDPAEVRAAIRPDDAHCPRTAIIWLEQPHNGWVMPDDNVAALVAIARERGLVVHMDGARIFNVSVARRRPVAELTRDTDSVVFCISKGLSAPVGSLLLGSADFIRRAHRNRKVVGGGLRQVGVLAAAGLYALDHMVERLAEDHANAQVLADGLRRLGWHVDRERVDMNIFFATPPDGLPADTLQARLAERGIAIHQSRAARTIRFVTHYGIDAADITRTLDTFADLAS